MTKHFIVFCFLHLYFCAIAHSQAREEKYSVIVEYLNAKNTDGLLSIMSDSCRIGNLPPMDHNIAIPEIISKFKKISTFKKIKDSLSVDGDQFVQLEVKYEDNKLGYPTFLFNQDGYLINLGIIKASLKGNPEHALAQVVQLTAKPDTVRIHFQLHNGLIYIPAQLNGRAGYFMFDSGAPVVILRKKYVAPSSINNAVSVDFTGMGGLMEDITWSTGNNLKWGGFQLDDLDAPAAFMNDMELDDRTPIFGLMGYGVLADYQLTFDYAKRELLLERVDASGNLAGAGFEKGKLVSTCAMRMKRHIPIIDMILDDTPYPMGIDCGANANLLKASLAAELEPFIDYEDENVNITGVGGATQNNSSGFLKQARIGTLRLQDMFTVMTDQNIGGGEKHDALPIVGLLGTPFLNQQKTTLNFNKGEISFY
ncbi:pepsin/retropepsin-like aspartic protease family protein [Sphingobacterium faecium]|uniref:pepsin/retropepsin-like aspartic protease family protein n=1 Tax=Sphingobacterium faecium TaxID=34087 RepID=UPI003209C610